MQQPEDIAHLYKEFGGRPETYRELTRTRNAQQARERWPLISALGDLSAGVPPVHPGEAPETAPQEWHAAQRPAPIPQPESQHGHVEPTGPLHTAVPVTPLAAPAVPPAPSPWGHAVPPPAPVAAPAPVAPPPVPPTAAPVQPPTVLAPVTSPALQSPSPLSRLARTAQPEAEPSTGLQQVFARLLGTRNRP